jgi:hypothetical protein
VLKSEYFSQLALSKMTVVWLTTFACLAPLLWLLIQGQFTLLSMLLSLAALIVVGVVSKPASICLTLAYLFLLGDIRRVVSMFVGFPTLDPLLLVGPIVSLLLALPLLLRVRLKEPLSKATLALIVVMLLEVVNPRQGSIVVGVTGAMFYVVPLLWFWIGRQYGTEKLLETVIYKVVLPLAIVAALLGLWQINGGFFPWEKAWIDAVRSTYSVIDLGGGRFRAFGFSVNTTEYCNLLLIGSTSVLAAFFGGRRVYGIFFPLLAVMLFLATSRGPIVKLLFAVSAAWALSSKSGKGFAMRLPFGLAVAFGILALALSQISSGGGSDQAKQTAASVSTQHQLDGLEHPLDSKRSTASAHAGMFLGGFIKGFSYPIGHGLGWVTMAEKLGSDSSGTGSTEVDISDAFVTMGVVGGFLYLYIIYLVIRQALAFGRSAPKYLGLPTLSILVAMGGSWIALGQYAIGPLVWFVIGTLSRHSSRSVALASHKERIPSMAIAHSPVAPMTPHATYR